MVWYGVVWHSMVWCYMRLDLNDYYSFVTGTSFETKQMVSILRPHLSPVFVDLHWLPVSQRINDNVIKLKHLPRYWHFVRGIHWSHRPVTRSFDFFFDQRLNKRLNKQSVRRWFETPPRSLARHCNAILKSCCVHKALNWLASVYRWYPAKRALPAILTHGR